MDSVQSGRETEFLVREHQAMVADYIGSVLDLQTPGLSDEERNRLGLALRFELENQLVPGLFAVAAVILEANVDTLNERIPAWMHRVSTLLPSEAGFLTEAGRKVDPEGYALAMKNLGLTPDRCLNQSQGEMRRSMG